ncbi:MAG: 16S rRNA (cytidine(1402)-2'-O)-methyltransferase [Clostridia bacterium]
MNEIGKLYVIATPIGNYEDITFRAARILKEVDFVLAEDTRVTRTLLTSLGIEKRLISMNSYSEERKSEDVIGNLMSGQSGAFVSDAGTPCISDPGYIMVKTAIDAGIDVIAVPGANACIAGLCVSGLPTASFSFFGFLPRKAGDIKEVLENVYNDSAALAVFYESPLRIANTLDFIKEKFPQSNVVICNDLTKRYERIYRGTIDNVIAELSSNANAKKGEYTIIIEKNSKKKDKEELSLEAYLINEIVKGANKKEAILKTQERLKGIATKKEIYAAAIRLEILMNQINLV